MNPEEEINALEELIEELLRGIQEVLQSGEVLSDEFQGAIAQELETTTIRIDQLRQETSQHQQPTSENIQANPSPDAQLLWILAGQQEQAFISYLREFPSPETQALLNNPTLLSQTISQ